MKDPRDLSDDELTERLTGLVRKKIENARRMLAVITEADKARVWAELGYRSLHEYLEEEHGLGAGELEDLMEMARSPGPPARAP